MKAKQKKEWVETNITTTDKKGKKWRLVTFGCFGIDKGLKAKWIKIR